VPRDTFIESPQLGVVKANSLFALGGIQTTKQEVGHLLSAPIDRYLKVNLDAVTKLAEALGGDALQKDDELRLVNVDIGAACAFIAQHHSQLPTCNRRGVMYSIGVQRGGRLAAVATAGSPTGRWSGERVDPRDVLELTRVASDGTVKGAASKLVARLIDLLPGSGRGGGPTLFVTYQLAGEAGTPYRALKEKGLRPVARLRGRAPGGARAGSTDALAEVDKIRWEAGAAALPADWSLLTGREA
jgi:hypothetical protein